MQLFDYISKKVTSITHYDDFNWSIVYWSIGVTIGCLIVELMIVGWQKSSLYGLTHRFRYVSNDFFSFILNLSGLFRLVGILFYGGIFYFLYGQIQKHFPHFHFIALIDSTILQVLIMLLVSDLKDYIIHWILHHAGWAWELHKFHHSATEMTMLTSYRSHAAQVVVADFLSVIIFITLGVPAETYLILTLFHQAQVQFKHSQIKSDWGWIGRYILASPASHHMHHSNDPRYYGKNLGARFIFWDILFGTYLKPEEGTQYTYGLDNNEFNHKPFLRGFIYDLVGSYLRSLRVAKDSLIAIVMGKPSPATSILSSDRSQTEESKEK